MFRNTSIGLAAIAAACGGLGLTPRPAEAGHRRASCAVSVGYRAHYPVAYYEPPHVGRVVYAAPVVGYAEPAYAASAYAPAPCVRTVTYAQPTRRIVGYAPPPQRIIRSDRRPGVISTVVPTRFPSRAAISIGGFRDGGRDARSFGVRFDTGRRGFGHRTARTWLRR